jgi:hypothetical protein
MAISPNVDFVSGAILTASQQNQFPRGIVAYTQSTSASGAISSETVTLTSTSFTAVANRYYKVTYFDPTLEPSSPSVPIYIIGRIRLTNVSGAIQQYANMEPVINTAGDGQMMTMTAVITLAAGATTICGTLAAATNSVNAFGSVNARRFILVEDIGPA